MGAPRIRRERVVPALPEACGMFGTPKSRVWVTACKCCRDGTPRCALCAGRGRVNASRVGVAVMLRHQPRDCVMRRPQIFVRTVSGVLTQMISSSTLLAITLLAWAACVGAALATRGADPAQAAIAPAGQGFTVTPGDLKFILK